MNLVDIKKFKRELKGKKRLTYSQKIVLELIVNQHPVYTVNVSPMQKFTHVYKHNYNPYFILDLNNGSGVGINERLNEMKLSVNLPLTECYLMDDEQLTTMTKKMIRYVTLRDMGYNHEDSLKL